MKVVQLKTSLKSFGLPTSGLKAVLQSRLLDFINSYTSRRPKKFDAGVRELSNTVHALGVMGEHSEIVFRHIEKNAESLAAERDTQAISNIR